MNYFLPLLVLVLTVAGFFALGRDGYTGFGVTQTLLRVLAALPLLASGILLHFLRTQATASIIPPVFPARYLLAIVTGVLEVAGAIGLFVPAPRRSAALSIAVMMIAVYPANIYAAGTVVDGLRMPGVPLRTALQAVYILLVLVAGYGVPGRRSG